MTKRDFLKRLGITMATVPVLAFGKPKFTNRLEISYSRTLDIIYGSEIPTVEEARAIFRDATKANNPIIGVWVGRQLMREKIIKNPNISDRVKICSSEEYYKFVEAYSIYIQTPSDYKYNKK